MLTSYGSDDDATHLLDNYDFHIVPVMNPDGYDYNLDKCEFIRDYLGTSVELCLCWKLSFYLLEQKLNEALWWKIEIVPHCCKSWSL